MFPERRSIVITILQAALVFAMRGWQVFPVKKQGKRPASMHGFKDAIVDGERIREIFSGPDLTLNLGIATGAVSSLVVIDIDDRHGGPASLRELEEVYGPLPPTVRAETGGGGQHIYFRYPGEHMASKANVRPGIDVRGDGGYVVAPPSLHQSGRRYAWLPGCSPDEVALADLPAWLLALLLPAPVKPMLIGGSKPKLNHDSTSIRVTSVDEKLLRRARAYVARARPAAEGSRNDAAFNLAGHLSAMCDGRMAHLGESVVFELMKSWNTRCSPPLGDDELLACVRSATTNGTPRPPKPPRPAAASVEETLRLTDTGNAERLVRRSKGELRYCHPWKKWLVWRGTHWAVDDDGTAMRLSKHVVRDLYREASQNEDADRRKKISDWAHKSENVDRRKALVDLTRSEAGMAIRPDDLDRNEYLLNCENGTLDLRTGALGEHRREDYITKLCPTRFVIGGRCPTWLAFLERVLPEEEVRDFLQRFIGYCLTADVSEQLLLLFLGGGANGKSTLVGVLQAVLGTDYAIQIASDVLIAKDQRGHPTEIADLFGMRMAFGIETAKDRALDENLIKQLTGGDRIRTRRMREDHWEFLPSHKLILVTNNMPEIVGMDYAIWRRLILIPFDVTIPPAERDPQLQRKLLAEREGILAWAVEGCRAWLEYGLRVPESVMMTPPRTGPKQTPAEIFVDQFVRRVLGARTHAADLYARFQDWRERHQHPSATQQQFGKVLGQKGFGSVKSSGVKVYVDTDLVDGGDDQGREGQGLPLTSPESVAEGVTPGVVPVVPRHPCEASGVAPQPTSSASAAGSAGGDR